MKQNHETTELKEYLMEFKNEIIAEIKTAIKSDESTTDQILKNKDLKKMLNCSDSTLENMRNNGVINFSKVLGTYYYKFSDVKKMLENNRTNFN